MGSNRFVPLLSEVVDMAGGVPVPFYCDGKLLFDFVHFDSVTGTWPFVERDPNGYQVLFAEPLTESQSNTLK